MDEIASKELSKNVGVEPPGDEFPIPRIGEDGKRIYDQEFFVSLARRGAEVWNRWRAANARIKGQPYIDVNFEGVNFRDPANALIDFSGFEFGQNANFSRCVFGPGPVKRLDEDLFRPGMAKFTGATFEHCANLSRVTFNDSADLSGVSFGIWANFSNSVFGTNADLSHTNFENGASLAGAAFGNYADLSGAAFGNYADFSDATFGAQADLSGVSFGEGSYLSRIKFRSNVLFKAWPDHEWRRRRLSHIETSKVFGSWTPDRKAQFLALPQSLRESTAGPSTFLDITFDRGRFEGLSDFSGRSFMGNCSFTQVLFDAPPNFGDGNGFYCIDFTGARIRFGGALNIPLPKWCFGTNRLEIWTIGWTTLSYVAIRLRRLRKLAEEAKNHDLERDLYIEERKAERGILFAQYLQSNARDERGRSRYSWKKAFQLRLIDHVPWVIVMSIYWALADYGRSFVRPTIALLLSVVIFHFAYGSQLTAPSDPARRQAFQRALWAFSISNAVPVVGSLTLERDVKLMLMCENRPILIEEAQQRNEDRCVPIPHRRFQLVVLIQVIFSTLCFFFAALALRNYFKLN